MSSLATFVTLVAVFLSGPAPALVQGQAITLTFGEVQAEGLDPALRGPLPGLVAAALESGGAYVVSASPEGPAWNVTLAVSSRNPWRLSARLTSVGSAGRGRSLSTKKHPFSDRESLSGAVEALVSEIHQHLAPAGGPGPLPLARALSGSTKAVDAYLDSMRTLMSGAAAKARAKLDEALAADPSMCQAAVERAYFDLTTGDKSEAAAVLAAAHARGACGSARGEEAMRGFELLARSDPSAIAHAEKMLAEPGTRRAGLRIRGLALGMADRLSESAADWKSVSAVEPDDPRARMWLGSSQMAAGDFQGASESFSRVTKAWPELLRAWTLRAESQVRMREPELARETIAGMKSFMTERGLPIDADEHNPDLMFGCIDLIEGRTISALKSFDGAIDDLEKRGASFEVLDTLHNAVIEMKRNLIEGRDPVVRARRLQEAKDAIDRYQSSQPPEHRLSHPWEIVMLRALIKVREGNTLEGWKILDEIKSSSDKPGYSEYYEARLSAAILLKEGDEAASAAAFERTARASDKIVDLIYVAQMQGNIRKYDDSRKTFEEIARRLERYDASAAVDNGRLRELVVIEPHLAAMIPIYHYTWARLGYETNNPTESRQHFNRMLKYLNKPDRDLVPLVEEAIGRGAHAE